MIDVVVVAFDARSFVERTLERLETRPSHVELYVVDNASSDGVREWLIERSHCHDVRDWTLALNTTNLGFAVAANQGAALGHSEHILFLNPDLELPEDWGWLRRLEEAVTQPGVVVASPILRGKTGNYWPGSDEWVTGACMLVRREPFETVGGFDEGYFLGYEDHDLCDQLRAQGYRISVTEDEVVHDAFQSPRPFSGQYSTRSELRYYRKWRQGHHTVRGQDFGRVALSSAIGRWIHGQFLVHWAHLLTKGYRPGDATIYPESASLVHWTRNAIVQAFLSQCDCDTLLWVDTDMACDASMLDRLRDNPANWEFDIVSGLITSRSREPEPLILKEQSVPPPQHKLGTHFTRSYADYAPGDTVEVDAIGMAFTLVRRGVYEAMLDEDGWSTTFFYEFLKRQGEDVTFCLKARELGFRVGVDTGVKPGHYTDVPITVDMLTETQRKAHAR